MRAHSAEAALAYARELLALNEHMLGRTHPIAVQSAKSYAAMLVAAGAFPPAARSYSPELLDELEAALDMGELEATLAAIDLSGADLSYANLSGATLFFVTLRDDLNGRAGDVVAT